MVRAPFQVLVLPFRRAASEGVEYAVFRRSDDGVWQGIAGGGEGDETAVEAAAREAREEGGVQLADAPFYRLKMTDHVPVTSFAARHEWSVDTYVVPQYFFACDASGLTVSLSPEHSETRWVRYEEAHELLRYDSNKSALWELSERLRLGDLPSAG